MQLVKKNYTRIIECYLMSQALFFFYQTTYIRPFTKYYITPDFLLEGRFKEDICFAHYDKSALKQAKNSQNS